MINKRLLFSLLLSGHLFIACAQQPTKTFETQSVKSKTAEEKKGDIEVSEKTVLLDARAPFEYSVSHLNGSVNVRPEDFNQREDALAGLLEKDLFFHARRMARLGINPDSQVVVVGKGIQGRGEEGRVAWTLRYMGVKNVKFVAIDYFSLPLSTAEAPPRENLPIWKPALDSSLIVTRNDFLKGTKAPHQEDGAKPLILDVRTEEEYLGKRAPIANKKAPDLGALNVPWTQFFTDKGLVSPKIKERLSAVGLTADRKIYVISNQGVESAAVTLALKELGYNQASNYAGGYVELIAAGPRK